MGAGVLGWEAEFAYTPEFFEADDNDIDLFDSSNVTTFMVNAILECRSAAPPAAGSGPISPAVLASCRRT